MARVVSTKTDTSLPSKSESTTPALKQSWKSENFLGLAASEIAGEISPITRTVFG